MAKFIYLFGLATTVLGASLSSRDSCTPGSVVLNNRQCTIECGTDHAGGDYSALGGRDFQGCINACASDLNCKTAQYLTTNGFCYLKNGIVASSSNPNVNGIICPDTSSSSSTTSSTTAAVTGCTAGPVTINGRSGSVECNVDHYGGDYSSLYVNTFQDCENACAANANCLTAQYDSSSNYCYLKSIVNSPASKAGVWGVVFGTLSPSISSTTTSTTSVSSTLTTKTSVTSIFSTTTSTTSTTPLSTTTTPTTSTSLTKTTVTSTTTTSTTTTSASMVTTTMTTTTSANPWACTGGYTTINNRQGMTQCYVDYPGGDYSSLHVGSFQACENLCASDSVCKVAAYSPVDGYCYLKSTIAQPVSAGVHAIHFPTAAATSAAPTSTPGCLSAAPENPYLLNGGFERDLYQVDFNPYIGGRGGPPSSNVTFDIETAGPYHFEGCKALAVFPNSSNANYAQLAFGIQYTGIQPGTRYTLSLIAGGFNNYDYNVSINFSVYHANYILIQAPACTYGAPQACNMTGNGNVKGQLYTVDFTAVNAVGSELLFFVDWTGFAYGYFILDDIRLSLAATQSSSTISTSSTTTSTTSSITVSTTASTTSSSTSSTTSTTSTSSTTSATPTSSPTSSLSTYSTLSTTSILSTTSTLSTVSTASACVATYTTINGRTGAVQCGIDRPYGDIANPYAASLADCEALCAANPQCLTAQYTGGTTGGTCYLKSWVNRPTHSAGIDGILFYTTASTTTSVTGTAQGCMATAPPNPYFMNGGYEVSSMDENISYQQGSFSSSIEYGTVFEGCWARSWTPTSDASKPRELKSGLQYQGLQNGITYNLTLIVGRPVVSTATYSAPRFTVYADGVRQIGSGAVCGYADTGPCPIIGSGGARGQLISIQFTAQNAPPAGSYRSGDPFNTVYIDMVWNAAQNDAILYDDFRLVPA